MLKFREAKGVPYNKLKCFVKILKFREAKGVLYNKLKCFVKKLKC